MGDAERSGWWGRFTIEDGAILRWSIGPLQMWIERAGPELRVKWSHTGEANEAREEVGVTEEEELERSDWTRYAFSESPDVLTLIPSMADRSMVLRPQEPMVIPSLERATLYVSTPTWIVLQGGRAERFMAEIPTWRPSDTWFGNFQEGEVCYAGTTRGRRTLEELLVVPHRATTAVLLNNASSEPLPVERFSLPVKSLSLYTDAAGRLWTNGMEVTYATAGLEHAEVKIDAGAPVDAGPGCALVSTPREKTNQTLMHRMFARFWR